MLYRTGIKRVLDAIFAVLATICLFPLIILLVITGSAILKGNPFFTQIRPGKGEKPFKLIKFRSMTNAKDVDGEYLSDEKRLTPYGRFLRSTSLDELPELFNIIKGEMSFIGPRPLLMQYLP